MVVAASYWMNAWRMEDGSDYRAILEDPPASVCQRFESRLGQRLTVQQDHDPKHTTKATLERHNGTNPGTARSKPTPERLLCTNTAQCCLEEWATIPAASCAKLIDTTPKNLRLQLQQKWLWKRITSNGNSGGMTTEADH